MTNLLLNRKNLIYGSYLLGLVILLTAPHLAGSLCMVILHLLWAFVHMLFEYLEVILDSLVEHFFHTDRHDTQIIVFYIMVTMGAVGAYFLWHALCRLWQRLKAKALLNYLEKKTEAIVYWQTHSVVDKAKVVAIGSSGLGCVTWLAF